jgi:hypothetical protein
LPFFSLPKSHSL